MAVGVGLSIAVAMAIIAIIKHLAPRWRAATLRVAQEIRAMPSFRRVSSAFSGGVLVQVGRQWAWQNLEVKVTEFMVQLTIGLWCFFL